MVDTQVDTRTGNGALSVDRAEQLALLQKRAAAVQGQSFDDLIAGDGVEVLLGRTVLDKAELVGVPFVITAVTFRPPASEARRDWVSLEVTTATDVEGVINDESTGVRRQVIAHLLRTGVLAATSDVDPDDGDSLDDYRVVQPGEDDDTRPMRLVCPRGLRVSHYANDYTSEGETYYLA